MHLKNLTNKDRQFIEKALLAENVPPSQIHFVEEQNFFFYRENDQINAFFCISHIDFDCSPYMLLEYFWINPLKRKKGIFLKKIAQNVEKELRKRGHLTILIDVLESLVPFVEKVVHKKPYAFQNGCGYFFVETEKIPIIKDTRKIPYWIIDKHHKNLAQTSENNNHPSFFEDIRDINP